MHPFLVAVLCLGGVLALRIHAVIALPLFVFLPFASILLGVSREVEAATITLDFEELRHEDDTLQGPSSPPYNRNGFTLTPFFNGGLGTFLVPGTLHTHFFGSTSMYNANSAGNIVLTTTVGGPFDSVPFNLLSIDLVEHHGFVQEPTGERTPVDLSPFDITFFGTRRDGTTVTNTFTITNFLTLETFPFSGFTNLTSVNWFQGGGGATSPQHQFDNLVIKPVPEPSTMLLLGSGLAGLGWFRRRRTSA